MNDTIYLSVKTSFRSSHELKIAKERKSEFGEVCDIPHGHSYELIAKFKGSVSASTGLAFPREPIRHELSKRIREPLDMKGLNQRMTHTSGEEIVKWCYDQLKASSYGDQLFAVELIETKKNRFYYPRDVLV